MENTFAAPGGMLRSGSGFVVAEGVFALARMRDELAETI